MLVVDAANVIGSRPDGWWRDRAGAARRFTARLRSATDAGKLHPPVVVVLEGPAREGAEEVEVGGVEVVHATGEGDDTIVDLVTRHAGATAIVVTADRELTGRVRAAGADVVGPRWLLGRLDA